MKTVRGLFETRQQAHDAVVAMEDAGIPSGNVSLVGPHAPGEVVEGAGVGAAVGGLGGLLAGLGVFAIPGIGPLAGAGWLAATLMGLAAGGVTGGLVGALTEAGHHERDAHVYAESLRRGGALVTAKVEDERFDAASAILSQAGSLDVQQLRAEYEQGGWKAFDDSADPRHYRREDEPGEPVILPPLPR